jgi:DNA-binding beta-propeller fold protein YncE
MDRRELLVRVHRVALALALASLGVAAAATAAQGTKPKPKPPGYHLVRTLPLDDRQAPQGIAVDGAAGRIYVGRYSDVLVLDTASGKEAASLPCAESRHGIALAPELKLGFVNNGLTSSVTGFDLAKGDAVFDAKTGENPSAPIYDASLKRVFTVNVKGCDVTAVDATSGAVLGAVPLGAPPGEAVGDGKGRLYVADAQKNEVIAVDLKKLEVVKRWPVAPLRFGHGLTVDPSSHRLFFGTDDEQLGVTSTESGKAVAAVVLRREVHACVFDPASQCLLATTGERSLSVVHEDTVDKFTVVEHAVTETDVKLLALDAKTHEVALVVFRMSAPEQLEAGSAKVLIYGK